MGDSAEEERAIGKNLRSLFSGSSILQYYMSGNTTCFDRFEIESECMAKNEGMVSFSSLAEHHNKRHTDENFVMDLWDADEHVTGSFRTQSMKSDDFHGTDYDWDDDVSMSFQPRAAPEVNLKNLFGGLVAMLTGRSKNFGGIQPKQSSNSDVSFMGVDINGDSYLHQSVYVPSAPPLHDEDVVNYSTIKEVLEAEPPEWLPDSHATACMICRAAFTALTRGRHHCRFCGGIFCKACSTGRCLLPVKFRERDPQRVCDICYEKLEPLQGILINSISNAAQSAKHDVMDWTSTRGWLNLPVGLSMEYEIYKASNTLRSYCQVAQLNPEKSVPLSILKGAKGLAILTIVKVGALLTYKLGTGLVVSRRVDGSWSAPSAILSAGLGWGAQIGGELMDFIIVLHGSKAVRTFCSRMHCSLGAGLSAAAGPIGRVFEADLRAGDRGSGMCYTYSCSKGAFVGVSLEGNIVATRADANLRFYGDPYLTTTDILLGNVERPTAASPLYTALDELYLNLEG